MTVASERENWPGEWHELPVGDGAAQFTIVLRRLVPPAKVRRAVVMIPGANSSCTTFLIPGRGLAGELHDRGCDVWLLDWRPSPLVLERVLKKPPLGGSAQAERAMFTLDRAVAEDIPAALTHVRKEIANLPLSIHAHCVGAGGLSIAVARGILKPFGVDRIVLSTLGLFYEVPWNTWIKAEDYLLETMLLPPTPDEKTRAIDPASNRAWPSAFRDAFDIWPKPWLPRASPSLPQNEPYEEFLQHLTFMVGQPYSRARIDKTIDGPPVQSVFGPLHVGLYMHLGQMVRRGYAARFDVDDRLDRIRLRQGLPTPRAPRGDLQRHNFLDHRITLVAGGDDFVWHRDSVDLMYEWLRREPGMRCEKYVAQGYNIQELYWAPGAPSDTYPTFARGLGC